MCRACVIYISQTLFSLSVKYVRPHIPKLRFIQFASSNFFFHIQMFSPGVSYCRSHTCTHGTDGGGGEREKKDRPRSGIYMFACNPFSLAMELYVVSGRATFFCSDGKRATVKMSNLHVDLILRINISVRETMCTRRSSPAVRLTLF
jgi:hypothetical protein